MSNQLASIDSTLLDLVSGGYTPEEADARAKELRSQGHECNMLLLRDPGFARTDMLACMNADVAPNHIKWYQ